MSILFFYIFSKLYGLAPFAYTKANNKVEKSSMALILSVTFGVIVNILMIWLNIEALQHWRPERPKLVSLVLCALEMLLNNLRNFVVFVIQIYNRKKLIAIVNNCFEIKVLLNKNFPEEKFLARKFVAKIRFKLFCKIIQIATLLTGIITYCVLNTEDFTYQSTVIHIILSYLMYTYSMVISSFYYAGIVLSVYRFYQILNVELSDIHQMMELYRYNNSCKLLYNATNERSCIAIVIYNRVGQLVEKLNQTLGQQVAMILFTTFAISLSLVFNIYCYWIEFLEGHRISYKWLIIDSVVATCMWTVQIFEIYFICWISRLTEKQIEKTITKMYSIVKQLSKFGDNFNRNLEIALLRSLQHPVSFKCCTVLSLNSSLFFVMMTSLAAYLIVSVQFELADKTSKEQYSNFTFI